MKFKKLAVIGLIVAVVASVVAYSILYKPHRNISDEKASFQLTPMYLKQAYLEDENAANAKYADKTLQVGGIVTAIDTGSRTIIIDSVLSATFSGSIPITLQLRDKVQLKGRFVGYDDLLEELKMDQVSPTLSD